MLPVRSRNLLLPLGLLLAALPAWAAEAPTPETVLNALRQEHPRLMLTEARLEALKTQAETDEILQGIATAVVTQADELLTAPPLEHKLTGPRLLSVSRECLNRVFTLGMAWRWTGEERYALSLEENLLAVCAFPDWNPSHFLDTAEMSNAVGVGLDWCWAFLSEASRNTIRSGLIERGLEPGKASYEKGVWWESSEFNWNQVCNAGLLVGALAIADTHPEFAQFIVPRAVASLPKALAAYGPDGAWMEGPGYWSYATHYTAYGLCALDTALGTDFGLSAIEGLSATGHFPDYTTGPTGLLLNYADSGERSVRRPMACMFWLAQKFQDPAIGDAEHGVLAGATPRAQHLLWYVPPSGGTGATRALDKQFRSPVDIVVMRSGWDDPDALFVGVKGGYNQVNHGHLDLGNFEMDALGQRWARDLGSDDYNLPGYWDKRKGGKRWKYYRLGSASHNVALLNGVEQDANATARITSFTAGEGRVTIDLSEAYAEFSDQAHRTLALVNDRRALVVADHFVLKGGAEITWGMTTDAAIVPAPDGTAVLTLGGKELVARILSPEGAQFSVESAEQPEPERPNRGVRRLLVRVPAESGEADIVVALCPVWPTGGAETVFDWTASQD